MTLEQSVRSLAKRDHDFAKLIGEHLKNYDEILPTVLFDDLGAAAWQAYKQGEPAKINYIAQMVEENDDAAVLDVVNSTLGQIIFDELRDVGTSRATENLRHLPSSLLPQIGPEGWIQRNFAHLLS